MNKKGFTLVELVVTISILLLLVSMTVPSIIGSLNRGKNKYDKAVIEELEKMARLYVEENNLENSISEGVVYCIPLSDLGDELPQTSNNVELTGRVDVEKNGDKINYEYNTDEEASDSCKISSNTEYNDESINLNIGSSGSNESDNTLRKLILGEYIDGSYTNVNYNIPNFKLKAPQNNEEVFDDHSTIYTNYCTSLNKCKPFWTFDMGCYMYNDGTGSCDESTVGHKENSRYYFSDSFTLNSETGIYSLNNPQLDYISSAIDNGRVYTCLERDDENTHTCEKMYEIVSYTSTNSYVPNKFFVSGEIGDVYGVLEVLTKAKVHKAIYASGEGSGLYRTFDNDGETFYYRGMVNNYVKIEGNEDNAYVDFLMRVIRINGNGNIRVVVDNTIDVPDGNNWYGTKSIYVEKKQEIEEETKAAATLSSYNLSYIYSDNYTFDEDTGIYTLTNPNTQYVDLNDDYLLPKGKYIVYKFTTSSSDFPSADAFEIYYVPNSNDSYIEFLYKAYRSGASSYYNSYVYKNIIKLSRTNGTADTDLKSNIESWGYLSLLESVNSNIIQSDTFCIYDSSKSVIIYEDSSEFEHTINLSAVETRLGYNMYKTNPTYICDNEIKSEVGTLSADDVVFAGANTTSANSYFYLYDEDGYVTSSGASVCGNGYVNVSERDCIYSNVAYPVINLVSDIKVKVNADGSYIGSGTKNDPYILDINDDCFMKSNGTYACGDENRPKE